MLGQSRNKWNPLVATPSLCRFFSASWLQYIQIVYILYDTVRIRTFQSTNRTTMTTTTVTSRQKTCIANSAICKLVYFFPFTFTPCYLLVFCRNCYIFFTVFLVLLFLDRNILASYWCCTAMGEDKQHLVVLNICKFTKK